MEYAKLKDLISFLESGTKLHIGVLMFEDFDNEVLRLEHPRTIHMGEVCWFFKNKDGGTRKCYHCRMMAIQKAQREHRDFGGYCINGVYEYTRPVMIGDRCAAIIFIGNIFYDNGTNKRLLQRISGNEQLLYGMERNYDEEKCRSLGHLIESYILAMWSLLPPKMYKSELSLIKNIKSYVESNLMFDIRLSDVAHLFHYNEQYLGRLFKQECGISFTEYVNETRIKRSLGYLEEGMRIINVASCVGFQNVTYFNKMFKRYMNQTPSEYRKNNLCK